jgi:anti-sigma B factor antagonist
MPITAKVNNGICRVNVQDDLTIYNALEVKKKLSKNMCKAAEMEVDLSGVNEIDSAGLQLLILFKREAKKQSRVLRLVAHSQVVMDIIDTYNLGACFGDPMVLKSDIG